MASCKGLFGFDRIWCLAWLLHCRYIMLHGCITFYHGRLHSINHGCRFIEIIPFCDSPGPMQKGPSCQPGVIFFHTGTALLLMTPVLEICSSLSWCQAATLAEPRRPPSCTTRPCPAWGRDSRSWAMVRKLSPPVTVTTWRTGQWSMCKFSSHGEELAAWKCLKYMAPHQKYVIFLRGCSLVAVSDVFFSDIMVDRAFFRRAMHNFVAC